MHQLIPTPIATEITRNRIPDEWVVLAAYRGSIAHGMYVPNTDPTSIDDKDVMIVVVPGD